MLEGLDSVDWGKLRHAYGWATGTPGDIRGLLSPDPRARTDACDQLEWSIVHQGLLYPAAGAAISFLVEIVASSGTPDKALVLGLLAELARGQGDPCGLAERYPGRISPEGYLADGSGPWGMPLERLVRDRLAEGLATYTALLEDPEPRIRLQATDLLAELPEHALVTAPALARRLEEETDETVRANAIWVLYRLAGNDYTDLLARLAEEEQPRLSRLMALGACVGLLEEAAPESAREELLCMVGAADPELAQRYSALPSATERFHELALPLAPSSADDAALRVLSMVRAVEAGAARGWDAQDALLTVALPEGTPKTSAALTDLQRRSIRAVARRAFPGPTTTIWDMATLLRRHGLPGTLEEMEQFLSEPLHPPKPWWRFW